jgi:hypothetical protein
MELAELFSSRVDQFSAQFKSTKKSFLQIGWVRTAFFALLIYSIYLLLSTKEVSFFWLIGATTTAFSYFINRHQKIKKQLSFLEAMIAINKEELGRLKFGFLAERQGDHLLPTDHDFADDLDLFGKGSLYQQLDRTELASGAEALGQAIITPLTKIKAIDRQEAIKTLSPALDWRQKWQAFLRLSPSGQAENDIISTPPPLSTLQIAIGGLLSISTLMLLAVWMFGDLPFQIVLGILPVNVGVLLFYQNRLTHIGFTGTSFSGKLASYIAVIELVQILDPKGSSILQHYQTTIGPTALKAWKRLQQLLYFLDSRANFLYWLLNPIFFIDLWTWHQLAKWGTQYQSEYTKWVHSVHELEVLVSMGGYAYLHPNYTYPSLIESISTIKATSIGHPLINPSEMITNDWSLEQKKLALVTGSNMSGKSTFLRTIGLTVSMSWIGLPVNAKEFITSPFSIFTSMRTRDNLSESTSSFYAELKRIRRLLVNLTETKKPMLYFLDEILKGTNSKDRFNGAKKLIERLIKEDAYGFISTHDLELAIEFEEIPEVKNFSFNSSLHEGKLLFDYKISNEVCRSTNASELMEIMGIIGPEPKS